MYTRLGCRVSTGAYLVASLVAVASGQDRTLPPDPNDFTERPELWAAGAQDWGPFEARCNETTDGPAVGKYAIALNYSAGAEHYLAFPKWRNANWNLSAAEYFEFRVKLPKGVAYRGPNPTLYLRDQDGRFVRVRPANQVSLLEKESDGQWRTIRIPLGESAEWETVRWLDGTLQHADFLEIAFNGINTPASCAHYVLVDGVHFGPKHPAYTPPNENAGDLDVLIIERTPRYVRYDVTRYVPTPEDPKVEVGVCLNKDQKHYPDPGEELTFTARVQNKGKATLGGKYVWILDGQEVRSGYIEELESRAHAPFKFKWNWDPADHELTFKITPAGEDYCPNNDYLTIRTNALMYTFQIERGLIARMESKVNMLGSYSCEDWLQGQLRFMNQLFENSRYDFAPQGITQRVMVGLFDYVDDGYLVTLGPGPYRVGELDMSCDGGRGCTALDDPWHSGAGAPCFLNFIGRPDDAWLHELGHQIGVIDDYQFITDGNDNEVNGVGFNYDRRGIMGGGEVHPHPHLGTLYSLYSPSDVMGLNATKSKRRGYFGEYLYLVPQQSALLILDEDRKPVGNAEIKVYQTSERKIDAIPEHEGKTDAQGRFPLKNRKAGPHTTETGCTLRDNPFGPIHVVGFNGVFLVTVKTADKEMYGFTTVADFNIAWASGQKDKAAIPVVVKVKGDERWYVAPPPKKN